MPEVFTLSTSIDHDSHQEFCRLVRQVVEHDHRFEIRTSDGARAHMISHAELQALENAVEFLLTSPDLEGLIKQLAMATHVVAHGPLMHDDAHHDSAVGK